MFGQGFESPHLHGIRPQMIDLQLFAVFYVYMGSKLGSIFNLNIFEMNTPPQKITVKINDGLSVDVDYFLTDEELGTGSEYFNMIVRGDFGQIYQVAQIFSILDAGNEEKEIAFVNDLVRSYFKTKA